MIRDPDLLRLERQYGIHLNGAIGFMTESFNNNQVAMDAQPALFTTNNAGVPLYLTTYVDTQIVRAIYAPNKAVEILGGEVKKGDWTTLSAAFPVVEQAGVIASYDDFSNNATATANVNFVQRQSYHYQTHCIWGDREVDLYAEASISYANEVSMAAVLVLNKFQNMSYFFGLTGLQAYGLLNDPSLSAAITPITKAAGGTGWQLATPNEMLIDYQKLVAQAISQSGGALDNMSTFVLAGSPITLSYLANANSFNVKTRDLLKETTPNMRVVSAVQYNSLSNTGLTGINTLQLICPEIDGVQTAVPAFTEKLRTHRLVPDTSSFKQKRSQGTWGTIIRRPLAIASMIGV